MLSRCSVRLLAAVACMLSPGCAPSVARSELPGTYEVKYPFGVSTLKLGADGQYEQVLRIGGRDASVKGKWSYSREPGEYGQLSLQGCLSATDGFGTLKPKWEEPFAGFCIVPVSRRFGVTGPLELGGDERYHYRRFSGS